MNFVNRTHTHISIYTYTHLHIYRERENGFHKQFTEKRVKMVKLSFLAKMMHATKNVSYIPIVSLDISQYIKQFTHC